MKRVMSLSPEMRNAVLTDMERSQAQVKPPAKVAPTAPKVSPPQPPTQPSVNFLPIPQTSGGEDTPPAPRGGSRTPEIDAGNGSASKRKILGIF